MLQPHTIFIIHQIYVDTINHSSDFFFSAWMYVKAESRTLTGILSWKSYLCIEKIFHDFQHIAVCLE